MTIEEHTIVAECYQLRTNFIYDMRESLTQIENIFLQHRIYCTEEYVSIRIKLLELLVDYTYKSASKIWLLQKRNRTKRTRKKKHE